MEIKVGDYIEFNEHDNETSNQMRMVVEEIYRRQDNTISAYFGRCDDGWGGTRGVTIKNIPQNEIKKITNEKPFTNWYLKDNPNYFINEGTDIEKE